MRTWINRTFIAISMTLVLVPRLYAEPAVRPVSQDEINWALALESKVMRDNYVPSTEETEQYKKIAELLAAQQQAPSPSSTVNTQSQLPLGIEASEIDWALNLEQKVNSGYQPSTKEVKRYESIVQRLSASQPQDQTPARNWSDWSRPFSAPTPKVKASLSKAELNWMQELRQRVSTNKYKPTDHETALYKQLLQRK